MRTLHSSMGSSMSLRLAVAFAGLTGLASLAGGCANDPEYIPSPGNLEAGLLDPMGNPIPGASTLTLPVKLETAKDKATRDALAAKLTVDVPYVKVGDLAVSIDWTIKNLDGNPGQARIGVNGGNEYHSYDPTVLNLNPGDKEAPKPPNLSGGIPIDVPANGTISGEFTEDQILEASIDLDLITRGNFNPYAATLQVQKNITKFQPMTPPQPGNKNFVPMPTGPEIPRAAFAQMVVFSLVFNADTHMVLEYSVRVRDIRGIMHKMLAAAPAAELTAFMPVVYNPAPVPTPP
jgi:hypothetical protein